MKIKAILLALSCLLSASAVADDMGCESLGPAGAVGRASGDRELDVRLTYEFDWENNMFTPESYLTVRFPAPEPEFGVWIQCSDFHYFTRPRNIRPMYMYGWNYPGESADDAPVKVGADTYEVVVKPVEWGMYIRFVFTTPGGSRQSDWLGTTSYITDQRVLARIQDLASVPEVTVGASRPEIGADAVRFAGFEERVSHAAVYSVSGTVCYCASGGAPIPLAGLAPGVYILTYRTAEGQESLKFVRR